MRWVFRTLWVSFTICGLDMWIKSEGYSDPTWTIGVVMVGTTLAILVDNILPSLPKKRYSAERVMTPEEGMYWRAEDAGEEPYLPEPCRNCGGLWKHERNCVSPADFKNWCMDPKVHHDHGYRVHGFLKHCGGVILRSGK